MLGRSILLGKKKKKSNEPIVKKEKKIDIPKDFIKKIKKLGMREEDAEILFRTKIDWTAVYSENKIYCTEPGCDYFTRIDDDNLRKHMITTHNYGEYPCQYPQCSFVGICQRNLNLHTRMHTRRPGKEFWHKCTRSNCHSSFDREHHLNIHLRIHNNDLDSCQYCQFKYASPPEYPKHLKQHFGINDFQCDQCDKSFRMVGDLNKHYNIHEGIIYCCLLCDDYRASHKATIGYHLKTKHAEIVGKHIIWDSVQTFIKIKTLDQA